LLFYLLVWHYLWRRLLFFFVFFLKLVRLFGSLKGLLPNLFELLRGIFLDCVSSRMFFSWIGWIRQIHSILAIILLAITHRNRKIEIQSYFNIFLTFFTLICLRTFSICDSTELIRFICEDYLETFPSFIISMMKKIINLSSSS